jgi:hypothetical protein
MRLFVLSFLSVDFRSHFVLLKLTIFFCFDQIKFFSKLSLSYLARHFKLAKRKKKKKLIDGKNIKQQKKKN